MFSGIIEETAPVKKIEKSSDKTTITLETQNILQGKNIGDSIAVNGVCVTITNVDASLFEFDLTPETLKKTTFAKIKQNDLLNLESSLTLNKGLSGHLVQGHIDALGTVHKITKLKEGCEIGFKYPESIAKYLAYKGSITINGVSLTISEIVPHFFTVAVIPFTLTHTNFHSLQVNDIVNLETDLIARYLERLISKTNLT